MIRSFRRIVSFEFVGAQIWAALAFRLCLRIGRLQCRWPPDLCSTLFRDGTCPPRLTEAGNCANSIALAEHANTVSDNAYGGTGVGLSV